jgi:chitinase
MRTKSRIWHGVGVGLVAGGLIVAAAPAAMAAPSATTQLTAPANLRAVSVTDVDIALAWDPAKDSNRKASIIYDLFFDGNPTPFGPLGDTHFDVQSNQAIGMVPGSTHTFRVQAEDTAGHVSSFSNTLVVSFAPGDNTPPTTPTNLRVLNQSPAGVELAWDPSTDESDFTYRVIGLFGCPVLVVPSDTTQVLEPSIDSDPVCGLAPGNTYTFQVFARDAFDNDSGLSNELTVTFSPA